MEFQTNSKKLEIKAIVSHGSSREYFSFDVFVNEELNGYLDIFFNIDLSDEYYTAKYETGRFSKVFSLGEGEKTVCIYFPWSVKVVIEEILDMILFQRMKFIFQISVCIRMMQDLNIIFIIYRRNAFGLDA